jgi:hypothetical protein
MAVRSSHGWHVVIVAAVAIAAEACTLSPQAGLYDCSPDAEAPRCPPDWFCHASDQRCWPTPEDAGLDVEADGQEEADGEEDGVE